jgi:hypothetical protein
MRISLLALVLSLSLVPLSQADNQADDRLKGASRQPGENSGWIMLRLEGDAATRGYQHGYLLSAEIEDAKKAVELSVTHEVNKTWLELRQVAEKMTWPKIPAEYQQELTGIAAGLKAKGSKLDVIDMVALNEWMEFPYYYDELKKRHGVTLTSSVGEHCSAFVATGKYTKDGRIVIGHNNWTDYLTGSRWKVIFDIAPSTGRHFIMDGVPGLIHSGDDFGINDAGIMITETTISDFHGFDENGIPEFARARKAMQYSESIDDFARIMEEGNNGGYANAWLVGDRKNNEIGRLELGLKNVILERTKDGYYVGANFPVNDKLGREETSFPMNDPNAPNQCRHRRWDQLMEENKGKIDVEAGKRFETDHYDVITKEFDPNERTLCGHIDKSSRGMPGWQGPFGAAGTADAKVADSAMAEKLSFVAGAGHPCGVAFDAKKHLKEHPEQAWQASELEDLKANAWTVVSATR